MEKIFTLVERRWIDNNVLNLVHTDKLVPPRPQDHPVPHPELEGAIGRYPVEAVARLARLFAECWRWPQIETWLPAIQDQTVGMLNSVNRTSKLRADNERRGGYDGIGIPVWLNNIVPTVIVCFMVSAKLNDDECHPLPSDINRRVYELVRYHALWPELSDIRTLNAAEVSVVRALFHCLPPPMPLVVPPPSASLAPASSRGRRGGMMTSASAAAVSAAVSAWPRPGGAALQKALPQAPSRAAPSLCSQ